MRWKAIIAIAIVAMPIFLLGAVVGRYELFPFKLLRAGYSYFRPASKMTVLVRSEQDNVYYRLQAPLFEAFPGRADTVMLGDSITAFAHWNDIFPGKVITNRGIIGDTTEGILARLGAIVQMNPHKVFIMAGINDLIGGSSADQVFPIYRDIVRALRSAGAQVFVQSTLLTAANYTPTVNHEVHQLNDRLRKFCGGERVCSFIDLNDRLAPDGYLRFTSDGLHLTPAGYTNWHDEIAPEMEE